MRIKPIIAATLCVFAAERANAAPILGNQMPFNPPLNSVASNASEPSLALNLLGRFGVRVTRSSLDTSRVRLQLGDLRLEYSASSGWVDSSGAVLDLPIPQTLDGQMIVSLRVLEALGAKLRIDENAVNSVGAVNPVPRGAVSSVPQGAVNLEFVNVLPTGGFNQVMTWQTTRRPNQVNISLSRVADWRVETQSQSRITLRLRDAIAPDAALPVGGDGLSRARLWQSGNDAMLELELTLRADARVTMVGTVLTVTAEPRDVLPPSPGVPPLSVTYAVSPAGKSKLHLVTIDPVRYAPKVLAAPWGGAKTALEFAQNSGAVAVVNGGYFDPPTLQAVDYIVSSNQLLAYWRGLRSGVGFTPTGVLWGAPRSRLIFAVGSVKYTVNSIQPTPNAKYLTMFVGDGFTKVGELGFTTLSVANGAIASSTDASFTPASGEVTLTFDPNTMTALSQSSTVGSSAKVTLNSSDAAWLGATDALAAGPRLVSNGAFAVNGRLEGFDTSGEIWRATRQVAFGVDARGWYVVAMLELGTPEEFANALIAAGLRDALRMDSGSSAQIALSGGLIGARWSRTVPNALAFVAR